MRERVRVKLSDIKTNGRLRATVERRPGKTLFYQLGSKPETISTNKRVLLVNMVLFV